MGQASPEANLCRFQVGLDESFSLTQTKPLNGSHTVLMRAYGDQVSRIPNHAGRTIRQIAKRTQLGFVTLLHVVYIITYI